MIDSHKKATQIRSKATRRINDLIDGCARQILEENAEIRKRLHGTGNKMIVRAFTGGYWSQSLDAHVMRTLGERMYRDDKNA